MGGERNPRQANTANDHIIVVCVCGGEETTVIQNRKRDLEGRGEVKVVKGREEERRE